MLATFAKRVEQLGGRVRSIAVIPLFTGLGIVAVLLSIPILLLLFW